MPTNYSGSPSELNKRAKEVKWTTVDESEARHVITNKNHGVSTINLPHHFLSLQHKVDQRHTGPQSGAANALRIKARTKRLYCRNSRHVTESFNKSINYNIVYGSFQHRVWDNCADLRSPSTVFVDG